MAETRSAAAAEDLFTPGVILGLILVITAFRLLVLSSETYPLFGDEAQYWVWSRTLDFGYFSKPPLIAWLIRAGTELFGDREFAVRFASPWLYAGSAFLLYRIGERLYDRRVGFWAALLLITLPAVSLSSILISTDVPLLFFWTLALYCLVRALEGNRTAAWIGMGVAIGLGLLSKYAMALFLPGLALYLVTARRPTLANPWLWISLAVALAIYSPNFMWNLEHQMASFRHTASNAGTVGQTLYPSSVAEFLGSQFGVFGPIPFAVLLGLLIRPVIRRWGDRNDWFLICFTVPPLLFACGVALLSRANANWGAASYVAGAVLVAAWLTRTPWRRRALIVSIALHTAAALLIYTYQDTARLVGIELNGSRDPYVRLLGNKRAGAAVGQVWREQGMPVLMTDDRMVFAVLAFYVRPRPVQVAFNPKPYANDQFELTTSVDAYREDEILYVTEDDPDYVRSRFREVELISKITIPIYSDRSLHYVVYRLRGYLGPPS